MQLKDKELDNLKINMHFLIFMKTMNSIPLFTASACLKIFNAQVTPRVT